MYSDLVKKQELLRLLEERDRRKRAGNLLAYAKSIPIPGVPLNDDEGCEDFYPDLITPAAHHELLLGTLERVLSGEIKRLMVFMPPGSAKSTYASVVFPTAFMGRYPGSNVIMATYGGDLAKKFGRKCRSICKSKEYYWLYNTRLTHGNTAADDWSLLNGSTYMCGGILSGITGNRADGLIIDDPIKGREESDSQTMREKVWEAYKSDLRTRLKPKGWQIIIQTRWHEDDLSGRILPVDYDGQSGWIESRDGERWYVLCLPAQAESKDDALGREIGEWLWTDWFSQEFWENERRVQGTRNWAALYQQRPAPDEGAYFLKNWFRYVERLPEHLRYYIASDYATLDGEGDWTVHLVAGVDENGKIYIVDMWRGQTASMEWGLALIRLIERYRPIECGEEAGQIRNTVKPFLDKLQRERAAYAYRKGWTSSASKEARAQAIRGMTEMGEVYFLKNAPWLSEFERELLLFPNGKHDDQVDAFSLLGRMLSHLRSAIIPKEDAAPQFGAKTFNELMERSKKARHERHDD